VADVEADVPQQADQLLELRRGRRVLLGMVVIGQQDQQVDVGPGIELAAAIAADGGQGQVLRHGQCRPDVPQHLVHQCGAAAEQGGGIALFTPGGDEDFWPSASRCRDVVASSRRSLMPSRVGRPAAGFTA
jgi:hypothetical protein